ncbi:MAG: DUF1214 domain-containing protein [Mycolicibacterium aromaticivorans]|nr:DUF1214 domain-containing protein [Mycolicibacterium aromaticivorans]
MSATVYETSTAFHELLDLLRDADKLFLEGPRAVHDAVSVAEGYRWLTEVLAVALDCYLWADANRPSIVPIVGPTRKFGGDNADAYYHFAPLDPRRTYRLRGTRGDAVYLSITVYGGPTDGRWSNRIVGTLNDRTLKFAPDGRFEAILSPDPHAGNWMKLDADAVCLVTRDYLIDPFGGTQATWHIEAAEPALPPRLTDAEVAQRLRHTANFIHDLLNIFPLPFDESKLNEVEEPYPVPQVTYAAHDPGVRNWVSTAGHRRGRIWFRWFLPEAPAQRPRTRVAAISELV